MNGSRRVGASAVVALAAGAFALGLGLALTPFLPARAAPAPEFTLEFPGLVPGVPQTDSATYILERDADLVSFAWLERVGLLSHDATTVEIEVCDSAGRCVDPTAIAEPVAFRAGVGSVTVTVELVTQAGNGETGAMSGRLSGSPPVQPRLPSALSVSRSPDDVKARETSAASDQRKSEPRRRHERRVKDHGRFAFTRRRSIRHLPYEAHSAGAGAMHARWKPPSGCSTTMCRRQSGDGSCPART